MLLSRLFYSIEAISQGKGVFRNPASQIAYTRNLKNKIQMNLSTKR